MNLLGRLILSIALMAGLAPAIAAPPPPVPALPDTERRTSYSISATTCACAVNFALYGDSTDYQNWVEVWLNGVQISFNDVAKGWTITSPTGPLASIPRPVTDAVLTFNAVQTGTVQIVGARRPRRAIQFNENKGVAARDLNQIITDEVAMLRETWDKTNDTTGRAILGLPGEILGNLPSATARASSFICWDATGLLPLACGPLNGQGNVVGPNSSTDGHIALFSGATGRIIRDGGLIGAGNVVGPVSSTTNGFAQYADTTGSLLKNGPTIIPLTAGGTNQTLTASNGGIFYSDASGGQILSGTATARQQLQSGASGAPAWSTATWPATTTVNQILYSSATNTVAGLASLASGALVTDGSGIPSISQTLPAAVQGNITTTGTVATGVWQGTAIAVGFGGTGGSVASGTLLDNITAFASTGYLKRTGAGAYAFNNPIPLADGGTSANLTASNGGLFYSTGSAGAILAGTGTAGQIPLSGSNAAPSWSTTTWPSTVTTSNLLYASGSNAISGLATGNNGTLVTSAGGVPSISSTLPNAVQANITTVGTINTGIWQGTAVTGTFIATNTVANSNLATAPNLTLKSNISGGTAGESDNSMTAFLDAAFSNAQGAILYRGVSVWSALSPGSPGQFLTTQGAGANPNWGSGGAGTGTVTTVNCSGVAITASGTCPPAFGFVNCSIAASVAGNNLTVALKDSAGNDPSATSPCTAYFRNPTLATGSWSQVTTTAALSFVANAGSTFGVTNTAATCLAASSCPFKVWIVGINSGAGLVLGAVSLTNASGILPLNEGVLQTSTACNACATATALGTIYSTAAQSTKTVLILGYLEWGSGLGTAGTYASAPTAIQTLGPGIRKPGEPIQDLMGFSTSATTSANTTNTVASPSVSITPTMSSNIIDVMASSVLTEPTAGVAVAQVFRAAGSSAACTTAIPGTIQKLSSSAGVIAPAAMSPTLDTPATTSQQTYAVCVKSTNAGGNASWCDQTSNATSCTLRIREIMG